MSETRESDPFSRSGTPALRVRLPDGRELHFSSSFHIGRDHECELQLDDVQVSRRHAAVAFADGRWTIRDLQSRNGLFADGRRIETLEIHEPLTVTLGSEGPSIAIDVDEPARATPARVTTPARTMTPRQPEPPSDEGDLQQYAARYFGSGSDEQVGGRTLMIRKAFQRVQKQQKRQHRWVLAIVAVAGLCAGGYAYYGQRQLAQQQQYAQEIFYTMKAMDVSIATVEQRMATSGYAQGQQEVASYMEQRRQMENNYEKFLTGLYDRRLTEKERLILRVTRILGECELAAPPDYVKEVSRYIQKWQSTRRFTEAIQLAQSQGYPQKIAAEFIAQDLPPQFFYLAMQESNFDRFTSGPRTRWGIAKGMWQFIPETGKRYGLSIGPLANLQRADPLDDRHDFEKATSAAARYVKELYTTDAQASGLLVMALYNWGENRVIDLVRTLPDNPTERNFWKLLQKYRQRMPLETYDYVLNIVAAAVIGENPRLFGFPFDSPLKFIEQR